MTGLSKIKKVVIAGLLLTHGCALLAVSPPVFPFVTPVQIIEQNGNRVVCTLATQEKADAFFAQLLKSVGSDWRRPSKFVSYAPSWRITTGKTEILGLKNTIIFTLDSQPYSELVSSKTTLSLNEILKMAGCKS